MIFYIYFLYFISFVPAAKPEWEHGDNFLTEYFQSIARWRRANSYEDRPPTCEERQDTDMTPFVAIVLSKASGNFLCMGSIIDENHVLTVRECLLRDPLEDIIVVGGYNGAWWGKNAQVKRVSDVRRSDDDLAVLRLKKRFRFTRTVQPIRLSGRDISKTPHDTYGTVYGVVGFVRAPWDVPGEPMPKESYYEMKMTTLMSDDDDIQQCQEAFSDVAFNDTTMFCTYENTTFCWGSLGSPTFAVWEDELVQMGIVVRAFCDDRRLPYLHLRIDAYEGWIRSNSDAKTKFPPT